MSRVQSTSGAAAPGVIKLSSVLLVRDNHMQFLLGSVSTQAIFIPVQGHSECEAGGADSCSEILAAESA